MKKYTTIKSATNALKSDFTKKLNRKHLNPNEVVTLYEYFAAMGFDKDMEELALSTLYRDRITNEICFVSASEDWDNFYFYIDGVMPNADFIGTCNYKFRNADNLYIYKVGFNKYMLYETPMSDSGSWLFCGSRRRVQAYIDYNFFTNL